MTDKTTSRPCWSCASASPHPGATHCPACGVVQPPAIGLSPFLRLGLDPPRYSIDEQELERAWLRCSRTVHPDRYVKKSDQERRYAAEQTVALNDAWRSIRDPWDRAHWLVTQGGIDVNRLDQGLLLSLMEDRETAEESEDKKGAVIERNSTDFRALAAQLPHLLENLDDRPSLAKAGRVLAEMKTRARLVADLGGVRLIASLETR